MDGFLFVFQNYVWVPVISAIVGGIISLIVPKVLNAMNKAREKKINSSVSEINIAGEWSSFFHEEDVIQTEKVVLFQQGHVITGKIHMKNSEYIFQGEFKNHILIGSYESNNTRKFERGIIAVRRINENLLSGYCTFVYKDKQIYNSPYILTLSSSHDVKKGTYAFCNSCVGKFDCCCNCNEIDMPILLPAEVSKISRISRRRVEDFAVKLTNNLYQMRRENDDEKKGCVFFQNNKCSIYENRPIDCRLFPFDFKEIDGEYWLIYYNDVKVCKAIPTEQEAIECCAHNIRPLVDILLPYMSECSDPVFCKRLEKQSYIKLFTVDSHSIKINYFIANI